MRTLRSTHGCVALTGSWAVLASAAYGAPGEMSDPAQGEGDGSVVTRGLRQCWGDRAFSAGGFSCSGFAVRPLVPAATDGGCGRQRPGIPWVGPSRTGGRDRRPYRVEEETWPRRTTATASSARQSATTRARAPSVSRVAGWRRGSARSAAPPSTGFSARRELGHRAEPRWRVLRTSTDWLRGRVAPGAHLSYLGHPRHPVAAVGLVTERNNTW